MTSECSEMGTKIEIKQETLTSEMDVHEEISFCSKLAMEVEMDTKVAVKEENVISDIDMKNEGDFEISINSNTAVQNVASEIDIKEEPWWQETPIEGNSTSRVSFQELMTEDLPMAESPRGASATSTVLTRRNLYEVLSDSKVTKTSLDSYVKKQLSLEECSNEILRCIQRVLSSFKCDFKRRWNQCSRKKGMFLAKYSDWLDREVKFPDKVYSKNAVSCIEENSKPGVTGAGRPHKLFGQSNAITKQRRFKPLTGKHIEEELALAAQRAVRSSGKRDIAEVLEEITQTTSRGASTYKKAYNSPVSPPKSYTAEEALSFIVQNNLTKSQYMNMRIGAKDRNCNIYPPYNELRKMKSACYPPKKDILITKISAEIKLQSLIDHTVTRLASIQKEAIGHVFDKDTNYAMIFKWGCDGSSGHSQYKKALSNPAEEISHSDSDIFSISLVPLQLYSFQQDDSMKTILWQNPRPSSTRFCRPIKLLFEKETTEMSRGEVENIEKQIQCLIPTKVNLDKKEITISSKMALTAIDGKVRNALSNASSQMCYICGATPKYMNNIQLRDTVDDVTKYSFGLSILHAWIKFFECLLHVAYRLEIKTWQVRTNEEKSNVATRKQKIIKLFRSEMGLLVDQPKPGGGGNSNDGNLARHFFDNPTLSGKITGINEDVISHFSVILRTISSGYPINTVAFDKYSLETAELYLQHYSWYFMPVAVHKILIHGAKVIEHALLPIGMLSEEAQEARNKHTRKYRRDNAHKMSHKASLQHVLNLLLVTSDPIISLSTPLPKERCLPLQVRQLLEEPEITSVRRKQQEEQAKDASDKDDEDGDDSSTDDVSSEATDNPE